MEVEVGQDLVKSFLDYNPDTGVFVWKTRDRRYFQTNRSHAVWNARYSGKEAGYNSRQKSNPYRFIRIFDKSFPLHRIAYLYMTGEWPEECIDHKNGNGFDNRWENLRPATTSQNIANAKMRSDNTTGKKGVFRVGSPYRKKYTSQICFQGRRISLGYFDDIDEAHAAYEKAHKRYFGEYSRAA